MVKNIKKQRGYVRVNHAKFAEQYLRENKIPQKYTPIDVNYEILRMRSNGHSIEEIQLTLFYLGHYRSKDEIRYIVRRRVPQEKYLRARNQRLYVTRQKLRNLHPDTDYQMAMKQTKGHEIRGLIDYYRQEEDTAESDFWELYA